MQSFPQGQDGGYVKLIFPQPNDARPLVRTYTVCEQRHNEIDVDFALHSSPGPASQWAMIASPGDQILVGGPGPKKLVNTDADWFLLAGDMTALPAIKVNLAHLPKDARGYLVLQVPTESDFLSLDVPKNIETHWIVTKSASVSRRCTLLP